MCRISALVPKPNMVLSPQFVIPFLDVVEVNGASNKDGIGLSILTSASPLFKSASDALTILCKPDIYEFLNQYNGSSSILGHVRIATSGKGKGLKDQNSHPFVYDNLTLVHNGHFSNYSEIVRKYNIPDSVEVDSDVFAYRLNMLMDGKPLTLEILQKCVLEFTGNFALAIYDRIGDKLWVVPHHNNLYLYDLGYAYVVNTTDTVDTVLHYSLNRLKYTNGTEFDFTKTKIPNGSAYILDSNGLTLMGKIEVNEEVYYRSAHTYPSTQPVNNSNSGGISTTAVLEVIRRKTRLLNKYGITPTGLSDLLEMIPELPSYYSLTTNTLVLLEEFFSWLEASKVINSAKLPLVTEQWEQIYLAVGDEYDYAKTFVPDFQKPYWLNTLETIELIPIPTAKG